MGVSLQSKEEENNHVLAGGGLAYDQHLYDGHQLKDVYESRTLYPVRIMKLLLLIAFTLLLGHLVVIHLGPKVLGFFYQSSHFTFYQEIYYALYNQFHLALEGNLSTYFSAFNLAVASVLLYVIHSTGKQDSLYWLHLSIFFLFLSIDESAQIHETFGGLAGNQVNLLLNEVPALLSWPWMVPYAVLTLGVGIYFLRFTLKLPGKTRGLFFLSGIVYVFAALVLEFFEAHFDTLYGPENLVNKLLFPCEEVLEMVGAIIFIYALLDYLMLRNKVLHFNFKNRS